LKSSYNPKINLDKSKINYRDIYILDHKRIFMKQVIGSGSQWEDIVGYSRAVRVNNIIEVAGTTAGDGEAIIGEGNVYEQTIFIFTKIKKALEQLGASIEDVVRTRMFVTNMNDWEAIGKAHGEFFRHIKPVATMVEVNKLIDPRLLIEIEVTAIIDS
jgi:enamine deaminase RidA (YjgF/YER057c/UK114 family)